MPDNIPHPLISDEPIDEYLKKQGINKRPAAPEFEGLKLSEIVDNPKRRFWEAVKLTLAGKTTVGLIGREVKNILKHVVPFGKYADATLDAVGNSIKTKTKEPNKMNWILNRLKERSTWRGIVALVTAIGVSLEPDQIAAIVTLGVAAAATVEVFFKEPQSEDA